MPDGPDQVPHWWCLDALFSLHMETGAGRRNLNVLIVGKDLDVRPDADTVLYVNFASGTDITLVFPAQKEVKPGVIRSAM